MKHFSKYFLAATAAPSALRRAGLLLSIGLCLSSLGGARAQQWPAPLFFKADAEARSTAEAAPLAAALFHSQALTLDVSGLRTALATAPLETQAGAAPLVLALPLPDGSTGRFALREAPIMAPALAAQFPDIKTYAGIGLDDASASVRLDLTPQGFHAQVLAGAGQSFYIDPVTRTDSRHYLAFYKQDMNRAAAAAGPAPGCSFSPTPAALQASAARVAAQAGTTGTTGRALASGAQLRTYRLALANTAQYATFHGNTAAGVMAAKATSVNRVVGVYEKELAVRLVLVANNNLLDYLSGTGTQPPTAYTNGNPNSLLTQNQSNIDAVIGSGFYDIGHVFSTAGGGLAGLGVVCEAGSKAEGETGTNSPVGDAFDIDYVAHEMGHQFSGNHPFNGNAGSCTGGNRNASTAWEPGSGSTIMAYAGICGTANDLQPHSDAIFHTGNYQEMRAFIEATPCGVNSATGNTPPVVTPPASGETLPIDTPFKLTATATDADGDALTYLWEELDLGPQQSPTDAQVANSNVPLFRSFVPLATGTRYFPRLTDLVNNTTVIGERLPTVTRALKFRCTARDQHSGPAGVIGGVTYSTLVTLSTTSAAGPFLVTAPNTALTWTGGTTQTVTWDVAGTTAAPVSCALVNLRLSTDGGLTYPTVLLAGTTNDGTQTITVPSVATTTARVMVEAADNYFFDISNTNFTITAGVACNPPTSLAVGSITTTTASLSFTPSAAAVSYTVTTVPATTTQVVAASPVSLTGLTAGTAYTVNVTSTCAGSTTSTTATVGFTTTPPPFCASPTGVAVGSITATTASVSFVPSAGATSYTVTTVPATTTQVVTTSPVSLTGLTGSTAYTVNVTSTCAGGGTGPASATFTTSLLNDECAGAIALGSAVSCVAYSTTLMGATQSQAASSCSFFTSPSALDVWYSFVATGPNHVITVSSAFDGVLQAFSGACGSLTDVSCIDNQVSGGETLTLTTLTAGATYRIRYYPYDSAPADGSFTICVTGPVAPPTPTVTLSSPNAELTGMPVTLTGTNFVAGSTVAFGGVAATGVVVNSATSITATVPAGAAVGSSPVVVTANGQPSASLPFTVLKVYDAVAACLSSTSYAATGDGQWHYLLAGGQVVAALQDTRAALGTVDVQLQVTGTAGAVRQDVRGHRYLDRNFRLTATSATFAGSSINVRFYALTSELDRLQAADATVTYAGLKASQYSGPNEDCDLSNDNTTIGQMRTLPAPATTPGNGVGWLVAQASVPDHFSEFFLTGSALPLPVELLAFDAERRGAAVRLSWRTASEKHSDRFEVERGTDGRVFERVGVVAAAGSSTAAHAYELTDARLPGAPTIYYRLRQVDLDGTAAYSLVRAVAGPDRATGLAVFPNPTAAAATLTGAAPGAVVRVFDALGRVVLSTTADAAGSATLRGPAAPLAAGIYLVRAGQASVRLSIVP